MLVPLVVSLVLAVLGAVAVAAIVRVAMRRLGLELYAVLTWFGLAEAPPDELAARRSASVRAYPERLRSV